VSHDYIHNEKGLPWHTWGLMTIAFFIPFAKKFVPGFIVLLGIYAIVFAFKKRRIHLKLNASLAILFGIFLLHIIGLSYSEHTGDGINEIGIKLSYFAFPFLGLFLPSLSKRNYDSIQIAFVAGCLLFIPLAVGYGLYRTFKFDDISYLSYQNLGIYLHPTYAAAYHAMAFFILMKNAAKSNFLFHKKVLHYSLSGLLLIFIGMLASKAGIIAGVISIFMGCYVVFKNRISIREPIVIFCSSILLLVGTVFYLPVTSSRIEAAVEDMETSADIPAISDNETEEAKSSTQLRFVTWGNSWNMLKGHPLGVGTGDTQYELSEAYTESGENYAAKKRLNAHNQFLQSGAEHGWPGVSLITLIFAALILLAIKNSDTLIWNFILLCGMNFMFESFLEVQAGIVFFCFWVLIFSRQQKT
jgi:O-antigen ligase